MVDDEPKIVGILRDYLDRAGFRSVEAFDGASAVRIARRDAPDLVVLDLGLPDVDGLDVIRSLRERSRVPIVVLTARGDESDRLVGLELIFERFHREPGSRGSGLGLAIARDLIRAHGGEIAAESEGPDRGTTIQFTLPVAEG